MTTPSSNHPKPAPKTDPASAPRGTELASDFTVSIHYDRRLYREDIAGSIAHAKMLARQGIITPADADSIVKGLKQVEQEIAARKFKWKPELEDIHMNVESRLYELIGPAAGRLHTARSRNDQVATDTRLYAKRVSGEVIGATRKLQRALLDQAEMHVHTVLPGYTHMQRAQPVTYAHHMLAYFEMFDRDAERFAHARKSADVLPLGSGALAGSPYPLDREFVAKELGFSRISSNSMDAVSDRDFIVEFLSAAALCMTHLSRMAEELIIWTSEEFGFVRLPDAYTSGSSIMPQKRNPDFAELTRGKTGRVFGSLVSLLTTLKGLPLTYNRDLQEDKEGLFDAVGTLLPALASAAGMISGMKVDKERMRQATEHSFVLATDIADYLVRKGLPFREAYIVVADLSKRAIAQGKGFGQLTLDDYQAASKHFEKDVLEITPDSAVAARDVPGGTAPRQVMDQLQKAYGRLHAASLAGG